MRQTIDLLSFLRPILRFGMIGVCLVSLAGCGKGTAPFSLLSGESPQIECVVLLHGMARTSQSMDALQRHLEKRGYYTVNFDYPSTDEPIETLAAEYLPIAIEQCQQLEPQVIHFVTHSLGGILVRQALATSKPENLGKTVMLSPPNQGSAVVDVLQSWWLYEWLNGPAGQQLSTAPDSLPNQLGAVDFPVGIIAGNDPSPSDMWLSRLIPGEDDGKVSIERTKVEGMKDFIVVKANHTYIMREKVVLSQTSHFLKHGKFKQKPF